MKSKIQNKTTAFSQEYPCLKEIRQCDTVVLFHQKSCGVVVKGSQSWPLGYYSTGWNMSATVPFEGEVVLSYD